jgi:hypothetical protein
MTERPYADMVIFEEDGLWYLRLVMKPFGPYCSRRSVIAAAIETARRAESDGETARVLDQIGLQHPDLTQKATDARVKQTTGTR